MNFETPPLRSARKRLTYSAALLVALFGGFVAEAENLYEVGDRLEAIELVDQHGETGSVGRSTKVVILVRDRFASEILKEAFAETEASALAAKKIAYITDLSRTPLMAKNLFVVPGMRLKQYSILLDSAPIKTKRYPSKGGQVTLLFLEDLEIKDIRYATVGSEVAELLDLERPRSAALEENR
ncbi:MAG: hypothetical protein ACPGVZ_09865 [Myxococcota bacterium]